MIINRRYLRLACLLSLSLVALVGVLGTTGVAGQSRIPSCVIDLDKNAHTCGSISAIDFVLEPTNHKTVFKVSLDPKKLIYSKVVFDVKYGEQPTDWTVNIGDSESNNGYAGDGADQSNDAEMQIKGSKLTVYGRDGTPSEVRRILDLQNLVSKGDTVSFDVRNYYLGWEKSTQIGSLQSEYLYALDGQPDSEGPVNYDVYAAFNRTIGSSWRDGSGVTEVTVTLYP